MFPVLVKLFCFYEKMSLKILWTRRPTTRSIFQYLVNSVPFAITRFAQLIFVVMI